MASLKAGLCFRCIQRPFPHTLLRNYSRTLATSALHGSPDVEQSKTPEDNPPPLHSSLDEAPQLDPNLVYTKRQIRRLARNQGQCPIGSKRRRVAAATTVHSVPFELLPFQCFQEARKVLAADRVEQVQKIEKQRGRIARLQQQDATVSGGERAKQVRLDSMKRTLAQLKIFADINDPMVKKRFEDGLGDMNKPIYRHLSDEKWRKYARKIVLQRVTQMNVIPDALPNFDLIASVAVSFRGKNVQPGDFAMSDVSEHPPTFKVQVFDEGPRLVSFAVIDLDIPNVETDRFDYRCLGLFCNIEVTPETKFIDTTTTADNTVLAWMPPFAQKGSPYHRIAVVMMRQAGDKPVDVKHTAETEQREPFNLRRFVGRYRMKPEGITMFRAIWDEHTSEVMRRAGIPGADIEFKRRRIDPPRYKKKDGKRYRGGRK